MWHDAGMGKRVNWFAVEAWSIGFLMLLAFVSPALGQDMDDALAAYQRSNTSFKAWLDCASDRVPTLARDRSAPASEIAAAAVDGCMEEISAHRRNLEAMFLDLPDWQKRADELYEGARTDLIRALAAHIVEARAKMSR